VGSVAWKDEGARARLERWFDRFRDRVGVPTESREVRTRHGPGHVLFPGPSGAPPVVCPHAMRTGSAHLLSELGPRQGVR
jgi:hypothetical protein